MEYGRRLIDCFRTPDESPNTDTRHNMNSEQNTTPQAGPLVGITSSGGHGSPPSRSSGAGFRSHREREYLSARLRRANRCIDHLMAREREYHREFESLEQSLEDAEHDNSSLKTRLRQVTEDNGAKTGYLRIAEKKLATSQHQLQETRRDNARLQAEVRVAQDAVLRATEKKEAHPMEDREVRDKFVVLEERLRKWARNYTVDDIGKLHSASTNEMNRIISQLDGYCIQEDWSKLQSRLSSLKKKIPFMLSQAVLAQSIFKDIFGCAFFVFPTSPAYCNTPSLGQMDGLYQTLRKCADEPASHAWRSQMLSMLSKCENKSSGQPFIEDALHEVVTRLVNKVLDGPLHVLLKPLAGEAQITKRTEDLRGLIHGAGQFSFRLWSQRTFMTCAGLDELERFSSGGAFMSAHRLHRLEEDDDKLDGSSIVILTHPLVLAWEDENAENYDQHKVWGKAIACVEDHASN